MGHLEDEIAGYETRIEKYNTDIADQETEISNNKTAIINANKLIKKYEEQQMNVRNNREYDALTKEIELQNLEIQICEKRINEIQVRIEDKNKEIAATRELMEERQKDLDSKKKELMVIVSESEDEEKKLKARTGGCFQKSGRAVAEILQQDPQQCPKRLGRGFRDPERLWWLFQHRAPTTPG